MLETRAHICSCFSLSENVIFSVNYSWCSCSCLIHSAFESREINWKKKKKKGTFHLKKLLKWTGCCAHSFYIHIQFWWRWIECFLFGYTEQYKWQMGFSCNRSARMDETWEHATRNNNWNKWKFDDKTQHKHIAMTAIIISKIDKNKTFNATWSKS